MLKQQSYPLHEIVIVDQTAAHDVETAETLRTWSEGRTIILLRQLEPNASLARNTGALGATGDVLLFLDDDISIDSDFLAAYAEAFSNTAVDAVAGQIREGDGRVTDVLPIAAENLELGWLYFPKNYSKRCETSWMASGNFGIRRSRFIDIGGMDANYQKGAFREESDLAMRFHQAGGRFLFQPKASVYHLGMHGAPEGGSRTWIRNKRIAGWHHCVGDWYFTLHFINAKNWTQLLGTSFRHFVFNRYNIFHPWLIPVLFVRWLAALPRALYLRLNGPQLIVPRVTC